MFLYKEFTALENMFQYADRSNSKVSEKAVDWHLDHSLKVIISITNALITSHPSDYKRSFNFSRLFVFTTNMIPRGKGKAPQSVIATEAITKDDLIQQLKAARLGMNEILKLSKNHNFKHPMFGYLNLVQAKKFIKIHTNHHLKIIRDIINE